MLVPEHVGGRHDLAVPQWDSHSLQVGRFLLLSECRQLLKDHLAMGLKQDPYSKGEGELYHCFLSCPALPEWTLRLCPRYPGFGGIGGGLGICIYNKLPGWLCSSQYMDWLLRTMAPLH